ncbi:Do family serine endopeptidase [Kordiimonas laminariae]|uniref:Do family serine endopeptidase n=1 Tax=Kordiimonas laminariae TaxID=2917717 RepID=UPI001FF0F1EF|nr:Do family serine endopeptidase [Kordiimonas laminariae]
MSTYKVTAINAQAPMQALKAAVIAMLVIAMTTVSLKPVVAADSPGSFANLVEKLQPSVVNISTVQTIERNTRRNGNRRFPEGSPFGEFWEQFRDRFEEDDEPRQARSLGSGFIVDESGIVITNNHVIDEADEITVILTDGQEYAAEILGRDALSDVAVLKIEAGNGEKFEAVQWGDSDKDRIGDWVVAIGNPFGLGGTVSAGIISARNRDINNRSDVEYIQTDAPINRGNSGGPLFNMEGDVIGVNTAIFSPTGGNVGIGFSIPANDARRVVEELREFGKVRRGWLGVGIQPLNEDIAKAMRVDVTKGALITRVEPEGPAADAGIEDGDIIIEWDGKPVVDSNSLSRLVKRTKIDQAVDVVIIRERERQTIRVKTGEFINPEAEEEEQEEPRSKRERDSDRALVEGMELAPLNDNLRRRYKIADDVEGVAVVRVARRTPAANAGIRVGAVIVRVDQKRVDSPAEVEEIIEEIRDEGRESVLVLINVRGVSAHVPLRLLKEKKDADN